MNLNINVPFIVMLLLMKNKGVLGITVTLEVDGTRCVAENITLTCKIDPFSSPPSASWRRNKGSTLTTCSASGCFDPSLQIDNRTYYFSGSPTGIHASFQIHPEENNIVWTCEHNAIDYDYTFYVLNSCNPSTDSVEISVRIIVGSVIGSVTVFTVVAVYFSHRNGWFCFATSQPDERRKPKPNERLNPKPDERLNPKPDERLNPKPDERLNPKPDERLNPKPDERLNPKPDERLNPKPDEPLNPKTGERLLPIIQKEAKAGSEVKLLPERSRTNINGSYEWTHDRKFVKTGNELMHQDGTIHWVSPHDSGLWKCKLSVNNADEQHFDIKLKVTVHQYEADEGKRVQLLHYIKKSKKIQQVEWFHKGSKISDNLKYQGGTVEVPSLYVGQLAKEDTGEYTCKMQIDSITLELPVNLVVNGVGNLSLPPTRTPGYITENS